MKRQKFSLTKMLLTAGTVVALSLPSVLYLARKFDSFDRPAYSATPQTTITYNQPVKPYVEVRTKAKKPLQEKNAQSKFYEELIKHEGLREWVYDDATGKRLNPGETRQGKKTIGVGFNLEKTGARERINSLGLDYDLILNGYQNLTSEQIRTLAEEDIEIARKDAEKYLGSDMWENISPDAQEILVNMGFNLGLPRLSKFTQLREALRGQDYSRAAKEMENSRWYRQTGNRAKELTNRMKGIN